MILITGSNGVLGEAFKKLNNNFFFLDGKKKLDLRDQNNVNSFFKDKKFEGIIHLAAVSGGIGLSGDKFQATLLRDNVLMLINILDVAVKKKISKVLVTLSSGMYPPNAKMPYNENSVHDGPAHESSYGYFYAKRLFEPAIRSYREQFGIDIIGCVPNGIFGENDNFSEQSTMLPSIINRMYFAKKNNQELKVWGDGSALREYTYSGDLAKALMWCYKNYSSEKILNVGSNEEVSIKNIVYFIAEAMSFDKKKIIFDGVKNAAVFRKTMDNNKFINLSKFKFLPLKDGIKKAVDWFLMSIEKDNNFIKNYKKV